MPYVIPHWIQTWEQHGSLVRCQACDHEWTIDAADGVTEDPPCPSCGREAVMDIIEPGPGSITAGQ